MGLPPTRPILRRIATTALRSVHGLQKCGPCGVDYEEANGRLIEEANADRLVEGDEDVSAAESKVSFDASSRIEALSTLTADLSEAQNSLRDQVLAYGASPVSRVCQVFGSAKRFPSLPPCVFASVYQNRPTT